ncbi:hypothetical protein VSDG_06822 [Cytospora chrysosperma]|uniref:Protein kinase domain-containing protein n=1 Tax=Cytospora chrysosperma TaxID=252740 RepID=A0A423VR83_CYTCH|nr:hypothetical protein VSDG_06822 [Valsa sordida]
MAAAVQQAGANNGSQPPQVQPCRYKVGKTLGAGSYSVVKECVHIDTGRYYAAKVINKRLMSGREHMVRNEIAVLKKVSMGHQNILTLVDYFETMNNLYLEMQAILNADYSFTPVDYWRGVSESAKDFIRRCLTIDPARRMTAHEALQHPFVVGYMGGDGTDKGANLLPTVKKNFNARRTLHAAIDTVRAINKLREGQAVGLMDGAKSQEPAKGAPGRGAEAGGRREDSAAVSKMRSRANDSGYSTQQDNDVSMSDAPPLNANHVPIRSKTGSVTELEGEDRVGDGGIGAATANIHRQKGHSVSATLPQYLQKGEATEAGQGQGNVGLDWTQLVEAPRASP